MIGADYGVMFFVLSVPFVRLRDGFGLGPGIDLCWILIILSCPHHVRS